MIRLMISMSVAALLLCSVAEPARAEDMAKVIATSRNTFEKAIEKRDARVMIGQTQWLKAKHATNADAKKLIDEYATATAEVVRANINDRLMARDARGAMRSMQDLKKVLPEHPLTRTIEAQLMMMQRQVQPATDKLKEVLNAHPHYPAATVVLAGMEFQRGQRDEAKKRLADALVKHPGDPYLVEFSAEVAGAENRLDDALKDWQTFAEADIIDPRRVANAFTKIGLIHKAKGKTKETAAAWKKSIDASFDVRVAMQLLPLQQQDGDIAGALGTIKTIRTWANMPANQPFRQQVMAQIEGPERALKLAEIDALIEKKDFAGASWRADNLHRMTKTSSDPNVKAMLPQIEQRQLAGSLAMLKKWVAEDFAVSSINWRADKIIELATTSKAPNAAEALAYAKQAKAHAAKREAVESEGYMKLVREEGWTVPDFVAPRGEKKKRLEALGLKEFKAAPPAAKAALKAHFEPLAAKRQPGPVEPLVEKIISNPGNLADIRALGRTVRAELGSKPATDAVFEMIPAVVWTHDPGQSPVLPGGRKAWDRMNKGFTTFNDNMNQDYIKNGEWQKIIDLAIAANKHYPDRQAWLAAGAAAFMLGEYETAADYIAVSAAVATYEERYTFKFSMGRAKRWAQSAAPSIIAAANRGDSGLEGDLFAKRMAARQTGDWFTVAELGKEKPMTTLAGRVDYWLEKHRFDEMLDAVVAQMRRTKDPERLKYLDDVANSILFASDHPGLQIFRAKQAIAAGKTDEAIRLIQWGIRGDWQNTDAHFYYAQLLEKQGKTDDAILEYNVAAKGMLTAKTNAPALKRAAAARDRLIVAAGSTKPGEYLRKHIDPLWAHVQKNYRRDDVAAARMVYLGQFMLHLNYTAWVQYNLQTLGYASLEEPALVRQAGEKALAIDKNSFKHFIHSLVGRASLDLDDPAAALKQFDASLKLKPNSTFNQSFKVETLQKLGRNDEAIQLATQVIEKDAENFRAFKYRSFAWEAKRDYGKASEDARAAEAIAKEKQWITESAEMSTRQLELLGKMQKQMRDMFGG